MSMDRAAVRSQLMRHEGKRAFPYTDTAGKLTIGIGRNLSDVPLADDEIDLLFNNDVHRCVQDLARFPWWVGLDAIRQRAVVDLRFNLGARGFRGFRRLLAALDRKDYADAAHELLDSDWAHQVQPARRDCLVHQIRTGTEYVRP